MKKQKSMGNKGFSLVELIIVIAIMAILVGVLAPNLLRYVSITSDLEGAMFDSVKETMGSSAANAGALKTELIGKLKSAHADDADIQIQIVGSNAVQVKITGTDAAAKKNTTGGTAIEVK